MYLKSLSLKGFKSFADKTQMVFDPGLTVVVGPNGSGKSNVSDAILWVLGEQSAKMLRGQAMEDVIFSGSSAREPVGVAEVTLVLDNVDHTLPIDFSEVAITRRMNSLTPAQNVVRIVLDELTDLLGSTDSKLVLAQNRTPNVIMLVGLQGSGKTTAAAKLAYLLKAQGRAPLLAACDTHRPAAADQLETLGGEIGVPVYRGDGKDAVKVASESIQRAVDHLNDVVIVDTAGRLQIDEEMMEEAVAIKRAVKPDQILMARARPVAFSMSLEAPVVISPKMSSSAARPPQSTAILFLASLRVVRKCSSSSTCIVNPRAPDVRGTMVIFETGAEPFWAAATMACPVS